MLDLSTTADRRRCLGSQRIAGHADEFPIVPVIAVLLALNFFAVAMWVVR